MKHTYKIVSMLSALSAALLFAHGAMAAVSAEDAARLKTSLTPLGAERAGNASGSIPAGPAATPRPTRPIKRAASAVTRSPATSRP